MAPAPDLNDLIATVTADAASDAPLARLATASAVAAKLTGAGDALVGHFVDACRAEGHTWAEISGSLGVSRQAAHKRYSSIPRDLERWTVRARQVLEHAVSGAVAFGHAYVGTEHLLLGLFPPGGIAATVLDGYGLTEGSVAEQVLARAPRRDDGPAEPPFTPLAAQVLGGALTEAISMGHNYIGTEHLLLGLFGQPDGVAAQILGAAGATHAAVKATVVQMLVDLTKT
ncbi:MAG: Clp protease N-terminal domain-containing protein [Acidimicrobiales bacterium]